MAFQKFSNMEQSLFTRFVRLGVTTVQLDAQGRARPRYCKPPNFETSKMADRSHARSVKISTNTNDFPLKNPFKKLKKNTSILTGVAL